MSEKYLYVNPKPKIFTIKKYSVFNVFLMTNHVIEKKFHFDTKLAAGLF